MAKNEAATEFTIPGVHRDVRITRTGISEKTGLPYANGSVDYIGTEKMEAFELCKSADIDLPDRLYGIIDGIPDDKLVKLSPNDYISSDNVAVRFFLKRFVRKLPDGSTSEDTGLNSVITVLGDASRDPAPKANCDW